MRSSLLVVPLILSFGCGGEKEPLFQEVPECTGEKVVPFMGNSVQLMSSLEIARREEGFDLDGDGNPDNKLWGFSSIASPEIKKSFDNYDLVIPFEFFDIPTLQADECVKFSAYLAAVKLDQDGDGSESSRFDRDCNDTDANIAPGVTEILDNGIDDDCDGRIDTDDNTPVAITAANDLDGDGVTVGDGDCDDTRASVNPNQVEDCGDGLDNDCDGSADFSFQAGADVCSPYTVLRDLHIDPLSLDDQGNPHIAFTSGVVEAVTVDGSDKLRLTAGPSLFSVTIPAGLGIEFDLRITGTTIEAYLEETANGWAITEGRLGGVLDPQSLEGVTGLDVPEVSLSPDNSLLDAIFANGGLRTLLALPKLPKTPYASCVTPDIDVDQDGLEGFCDSNPTDEVFIVDVCIDGDGTQIFDTEDTPCTEAKDADGNYLFRDGISVALKFTTSPARLAPKN